MDASTQSSASPSPHGRPQLRVAISPSHVQQIPMLIPSPTSPIKSVSGTIFEGSHSTLFHAAQKDRQSRLDQLPEDSEPPNKKPKSHPSSDEWMPAQLTHPMHPQTAIQRSSYDSRSSDTDPSKFQSLHGLGITFGSDPLDDSAVAAAQEKYEHTYHYEDSRQPDDSSVAAYSNGNSVGGTDYLTAPTAAQMADFLNFPPPDAGLGHDEYPPSRLDSVSPSKLTVKGLESTNHDNSWSSISETDTGAEASPFRRNAFAARSNVSARNQNAYFMQNEEANSHARKRRLSTGHASTWRMDETLHQGLHSQPSPTVTHITIGDDSPHFSFVPSQTALPLKQSTESAPHDSLSMLNSSPPIAAPAILKINDYRTAALKRPRRRLSKAPPKPRASSAPVYSLMTTGRLPVTPKGTYEPLQPRVLSYIPTSAATSPTHSMLITQGIDDALRRQQSGHVSVQSPPQLVLTLCANQRRTLSTSHAMPQLYIPIGHMNSEKSANIPLIHYDDESLCKDLYHEYRKHFCPSKWRYHCSARVLKRICISSEESSGSGASPRHNTGSVAPVHNEEKPQAMNAQPPSLMKHFRHPARGRGKHMLIDWLKHSAHTAQQPPSHTGTEDTPFDQKEQWSVREQDHPRCSITFIEGWAISRIAWALFLLALLSILALVLWTVLGSTQSLFDTGTGWMQAGGRVGTGALLALVVLFLGGTGIAGWIGLSWMCA